MVDPNDEKQLSGITFAQDETIFSSTSSRDDFGTTKENFTVRARIVEDDPSLGRIRVDGGEHTFFSEDSLIGLVRGSGIKQAKIKRIEDGLFGLHHFATTGTGDYINPYSAPDGTPLGRTAASGIYANTPPRLDETRLGIYLGLSGDRSSNFAVSNFEYENNENFKKTSISLLHPTHLSLVVTEFEELLTA